MSLRTLARRAMREWQSWKERRRFFKALPEVEQSYRIRSECRRLHKRGVTAAERAAYRATNAALGVRGMERGM